MKRIIRSNVFETNSSSTHTLSICTEKEFEDWKDGKLLVEKYNNGKANFIPMDENEGISEDELKEYYEEAYKDSSFVKDFNELDEEEKKDLIREYKSDVDDEYMSYEDWGEYLETYVEHYTTESGDKIVVFGEFGHDY